MSMAAGVHPTADVSDDAQIGEGSHIWHLAQVREGASLGQNCTVGRGAYVGPGVLLGDNCKVQNYALLYDPARLGDGVFIGPGVVLTNDQYPRAIDSHGTLLRSDRWSPVGVVIESGASIGARAVCVAPLTIGRWALIAAGAVVIDDVPAHALVAGVPSRRIGWVGRSGKPLDPQQDGVWQCPETAELYLESEGRLTALDHPLPSAPKGSTS